MKGATYKIDQGDGKKECKSRQEQPHNERRRKAKGSTKEQQNQKEKVGMIREMQ
jgi:hypothetical protein